MVSERHDEAVSAAAHFRIGANPAGRGGCWAGLRRWCKQCSAKRNASGRSKTRWRYSRGRRNACDLSEAKLDEKAGAEDPKGDDSKATKRPGAEKHAKTAELIIHEARTMAPETIPAGSRFKGYQDYGVPDSRDSSAEHPVPRGSVGKRSRGDASWVSCRNRCEERIRGVWWVPWRDWGVDSLTGSLERILTENQDLWQAEKDAARSHRS